MKHRVGTLEFTGRNFLEFSALIETNAHGFPKDIVFASFYESFRREDPITMQLRLNDLFAFCEALKETIMRGKNGFEKITQSHHLPAKLFSEYDGKLYYIKMIRGGRMLSMGFDAYAFRAAHIRLVSLAKRLEDALYKAQQGVYHA